MVNAMGTDARPLGQSKTVFFFVALMLCAPCRAVQIQMHLTTKKSNKNSTAVKVDEREEVDAGCEVCYGRQLDPRSNERESGREREKERRSQATKKKTKEEEEEAKNKKSGYSSMFCSTAARYGLLIAIAILSWARRNA